MTKPTSYRSPPTQLVRVVFWAFGLANIIGAGVLIFDSMTGRKPSGGSPIPFAVASLLAAALAFRVSLAVLMVSDDHIRIVNWFRTYHIPRAAGLKFSFGNDAPDAPLYARDRMHVVLRVNAHRTVNVAALMLSNMPLGVNHVHQLVDDLNARMRAWDSPAAERAETT